MGYFEAKSKRFDHWVRDFRRADLYSIRKSVSLGTSNCDGTRKGSITETWAVFLQHVNVNVRG
jgi:hypothetical protein